MFSVFQEYTFEDIVRVGIALIFLFATLIAVGYIIWGGFLMILSGGNEEKIKPAVNHIRHAVIGVIFLIGILFIFPIIINLFGLSYGEYMKPRAIFATIGELSNKLFGGESSTQTDSATDTSTPIQFEDL